MRTILLICTGNTCRSPMAEAIARDALDRGAVRGAGDVFVASAGVHAFPGAAVSPEVIATLARLGIDHRGAAKRLTAEMIRRADFVLAMADSHRDAASALVEGEPEQLARILPLDPDGEIDDPIGQGQSAYDRLAVRLSELVPRRLSELLAAGGRSPTR